MYLKRLAFLLFFLGVSATMDAQSLKGSPSAMKKQFKQADLHDFTRLLNGTQFWRFVKFGALVKLDGNVNYMLDNVSRPYTRPATKLFVERLSSQYRKACGEKLVVTSLTRPVVEQPRNASRLSVHPHGMSVDFRAPTNTKCRRWLEETLLLLEKRGVLEATRERKPPHYHVAVFSALYQNYVSLRSKPRSTKKAHPADKPRRPVLNLKQTRPDPKRR